MASIYENLRTDRQYTAMMGLTEEKFNALFETFKTIYVPKPNNQITGKPCALQNSREALCFILTYYKLYPTLQILGMMFGFSDKTAYEYLEEIKPVLKKTLEIKNSMAYEVFKDQAEFDKAFEGVTDMMIDGFELPVERDKDKVLQQEDYSGKKNVIPK
jgi:Helix-turn-helix of DDE superfamily endonuclease